MEACIVKPVHNFIRIPYTNLPSVAYSPARRRGNIKFDALPPNLNKFRLFRELVYSQHTKTASKNSSLGLARCDGLTTQPPEGATSEDARYMRLCVRLAKKAVGCTSPNPMVGCVIVKDRHIVGQGFHPKAGEPHAEVFALREANTMAEGATAYVSLEPCNHYGRTPPCTQALIQSKVRRVVVGMVDPNPIVASKGVATLRNSGIDVIVGVEEQLCRTLNEAYIYRMLTGKPFATMRFSMSLDGGMLDYLGDGAAEEGGYYSELLQEYDAIIISEYDLHDNPKLLSFEVGAKQPLRIVVTRTFDLPIDSLVFNTNLAPTLVLADEKAVVDDVQNAGKRSVHSTEMLLRQKGVDVVILKRIDFDSILEVCSQRGLCCVLFDSRGSVSFGRENFFVKWALGDEAFQKLVVAVCPVISGKKKVGLDFDIPSGKLNRLSTRISKDVAVVEGYLPKNFS